MPAGSACVSLQDRQIEENAYQILALLVSNGIRSLDEVVDAIRRRIAQDSEPPPVPALHSADSVL